MNELKIINPSQVYFYIKNGVEPLRVECGHDNKLVYIFTKNETNELFTQWMNNPSRPKKAQAHE